MKPEKNTDRGGRTPIVRACKSHAPPKISFQFFRFLKLTFNFKFYIRRQSNLMLFMHWQLSVIYVYIYTHIYFTLTHSLRTIYTHQRSDPRILANANIVETDSLTHSLCQKFTLTMEKPLNSSKPPTTSVKAPTPIIHTLSSPPKNTDEIFDSKKQQSIITIIIIIKGSRVSNRSHG